MKTITPYDLQHLLTSQPDLTVLDVRTPVEFAEVHPPLAHNIPLDLLDPTTFHELDMPVYIFCRSGGRATQAAEKFIKSGLDQVIVVEGGTQAWIAAGLPVDRGTTRVISLERQVRIAAGSLVLIGVLLAWLVQPWFIGLSTFVGTGLVFAGITDWCGMGLLLAKLPWNARA